MFKRLFKKNIYLVDRIEIEQEIKSQEKLKQKYYVPSILGKSRLSKFEDEPIVEDKKRIII